MGKGPNADHRSLDAIIRRLRRKVESATGAELPVKMLYNKGYAFVESILIEN